MEDSDLKSGRAPDRGRSPSEPGGEEVGDEEVKERRAERSNQKFEDLT